MNEGPSSNNAAISPALLFQAIKQQWCCWEDCQGSHVTHTTWGSGIITKVESRASRDPIIWVDFRGATGAKRFVANSICDGMVFSSISLPGKVHRDVKARQQQAETAQPKVVQPASKPEARRDTPAPATKQQNPGLHEQPSTQAQNRPDTHRAAAVRRALQQYGVDRLYYMTPVANVPSILHHGILSHNTAAGLPHADFSLAWMQDQRDRTTIPIGNRPLHDYANLYFATHTPMQYVLTHPNKWGHPQISQDELVFVEVDPVRAFLAPGMVFTDGNAGRYLTCFYCDPKDLQCLDWNILRQKRGTNSDYRRLKAAEVLVWDRIPVDWFMRIVVYSERGGVLLGKQVQTYNKRWRTAVTVACAYEIDTSLYY
jgi:hypothetical protein